MNNHNTNKRGFSSVTRSHITFKILVLICIAVGACSSGGGNSDDDSPNEPDSITPSNLEVTFEVVGVDGSHPNGDGSGVVRFTATATNAVNFGFKFDNGPIEETATGMIEHTFDFFGTNDYNVSVYAYSTTDHSIRTDKIVTVFVESELIWADEFDVDGAVSSDNWILETIPPNNGSWWNGEKQHYTDRIDNAYVSDGTLKIVAKKESYTFQNSTQEYTSARLNSKFAFTYGRVDVRAKLPSGQGTWPAIWTLGENIETVGWPACGEIDIMEHWGHNPTIVSSATHTPACSGGCENVTVGETEVNDYDTEFHIYSIEWDTKEIRFYLDDQFLYAYGPAAKNSSNWPYTANQFILLNVAMGGSWFNIDPSFTQAIMEIDYVRVYQ